MIKLYFTDAPMDTAVTKQCVLLTTTAERIEVERFVDAVNEDFQKPSFQRHVLSIANAKITGSFPCAFVSLLFTHCSYCFKPTSKTPYLVQRRRKTKDYSTC